MGRRREMVFLLIILYSYMVASSFALKQLFTIDSKQQLIGRSSYDNISSLSVVEHRRGGRGVVPMYAAASSHRRGKHRNCGNRHNNYVEFIVVVEVFVSIAILCSLI
ncbi:hypothetical protein IC582_022803 [Cucumis melo]